MTKLTRRSFTLLAAASVAGLAFAGTALGQETKRIALLINGNLGDKSFFDSAAAGFATVKAKHADAVETKIIEMGTDQTKWKPTLQDISEQGYDAIFLCTFEIADILSEVALDYPDQVYVLMDGTVPYDADDYKNVYSVVYKQNEASYLAGMLGAGLMKSGAVPADQGTTLGFLGGIDIPVINDFLIGYIEGAQSVDPAVKVAIAYAGSFNDAAKGKELALAQYRSGTAIGFNVAGLTGLGQLAAAKDTGKYAIGVNSDQEAIFAETDPEMAARVVSSVLKRLDVTVERAYELLLTGNLPVGKVEALGLKEGAVGLVETGVMAKVAPDELKAQISAASDAIIAGTTVVSSAFGMETAAIETLRQAVRP